jgi:hypothetical protein
MEYAIQVRHPGFLDRFLRDAEPPANIGMSIWWADDDKEILRWRRQESAEQVRRNYELHFAAKGEKAYSFVIMVLVHVPSWQEA